MRLQLLTCQPGTWADSQGRRYKIARFLWHRLDCFVRIVHGIGDSIYVCIGQNRPTSSLDFLDHYLWNGGRELSQGTSVIFGQPRRLSWARSVATGTLSSSSINKCFEDALVN